MQRTGRWRRRIALIVAAATVFLAA